jgi:AraC-like DNA-binding protein
MGYNGTRFSWVNRRIRSDETVIGQVVYQPGGFCGTRIQKDYELVIIHAGECQLNLDGKKHVLSANHVCLLFPGHKENYTFSTVCDTHHSWCTIASHAIPTYLEKQLKDLPFSVPCSETFNRLLSSAFHLEGMQTETRDKLINSIGETLFVAFVHIASQLSEHNLIDTCVSKAVSYMEEHFSEADCLKQARVHARVSKNTLITKFKVFLGTTPDRYLWQLRAEHGIAMLTETGLTAAEIAFQCGFKNQFHFSRKVTDFQGISPREFRRRAWGK